MKNFLSSFFLAISLTLVGCANIPSDVPVKQGMVIGIQNTMVVVNDPNLTGAAIGGVAGGVVGHQFGRGNGKTAMTILGALGGAAVGSQVNSHKTIPGYAITVRGNDGQIFTFSSENYIPVGQVINYKNQNNHVTLY